MRFENSFPSAGRDPRRDNKFIPLEELPSHYPDPETQLILDESSDEEAEEDETDDSLPGEHGDFDPGVPPADGETEYDRLVALAQTRENLLNHAPSPSLDDVDDVVLKNTINADKTEATRKAKTSGFWGGWMNGRRGREHPGKHQRGGDSIRGSARDLI